MFFKIDKKLIDDIRLLPQYKEFCFSIEEDNNVIVQDNLTHTFLLDSLNICDNIIKYYFATNKNLITKNEYDTLIKNGYGGKSEFRKHPYCIEIFGAFHAATSFCFKLESVVYLKNSHINDNNVEYLSDLIPYFIEYSKGFKLGYDSFYDVEIKPLLIDDFADKSDYIYKVFEFLTKKTSNICWLSNYHGFTYDGLNKGSIIVSKGFEDGQRQGFFYKAWTIVFSNNNLFEPLFNGYYSNNKANEVEIKKENNNEIPSFESKIPANQIPDLIINKTPKQTDETSIKSEHLKYNHIFKGNAFDVWQYMFNEFGINESSRTDVKFMFEEMRKEGEGLIHNTVNQKTFLEWITSTYDGMIIEKTSNHNRTKSRLQTYARAKKLYKE